MPSAGEVARSFSSRRKTRARRQPRSHATWFSPA
jgi:hypothetical protein